MNTIVAVAFGGIFGSLARWGISLPFTTHGFPWQTLIVNYIGSAILMALLIKSYNNPKEQWWWRPAIGAGFCGGFTTFSAFALEVEEMLAKNHYGQAGIYMCASLFGTYAILFIVSKIFKPQVQQ